MSISINVVDLNLEVKKKILAELVFEQVLNTSGKEVAKKNVYSYQIIDEGKNIIVPMNYCKTVLNITTTTPPPPHVPIAFPPFVGTLFPGQVTTRKECIDLLNKNKTCVLSLPVGCGKCLAPDTGIVMYSGQVKKVQDIVCGDVLMGDDNTPRTVQSTVTGQDDMYTVLNNYYNVKYTVNSEHILTLVSLSTRKIEDVPIKHLIQHPQHIIKYKGYRVCIDHFEDGSLSKAERMKELNSYFKTFNFFETTCPDTKERIEFLGRSLGLSMRTRALGDGTTFHIKIKSGKPDVYPFIIKYAGVGVYHGFELDGNGRFLLSDFTVTHNTATAINISTKIKLKTLVIVNRLTLIDQWKESIKKFCPGATVCVVKSNAAKVFPSGDYHFYIMNAINVGKFSRESFKDIGYCVVDELHMIMSEVLSRSLWKLCPKYLLGLSATPYRIDGLDGMIDAYFGKERVVLEVQRNCKVYKVSTDYTPQPVFNRFGKLDWSAIINNQSMDKDRNTIIVNLVLKHPERYFLLLTKRIEQGNVLSEMLTHLDVEHDCLFGSNKYVKTDKHVLIGTVGKCGTGFDEPKLNTLVLCCDVVNYYIQILGRVMRGQDTDAWVFDLVDNNNTMVKHYRERCKTYKKNKFEIVNY